MSYHNLSHDLSHDSRLGVARGLPAELHIYLIPEPLLLPRSGGDLQGDEVIVLVFGLPVSHVLQQESEHVHCFFLLLFVSSHDHGLADGFLGGGGGGGTL